MLCPKAGRFTAAPPARPSFPFGARRPAAAERGLGWAKKSPVPTAEPLLPQATEPQLAHTAEYQSQKFQSHKINNIRPCEPRNL